MPYNKDKLFDTIVDGGYLPHFLLRLGARWQTRNRIAEIATPSPGALLERKMVFVDKLLAMPMAVEEAAANEQHYEVTAGVLAAALGPRAKYSACLYEKGNETIEEAELAMLESYPAKMELEDGMTVLDLGCGWGSATIFLAERFPKSKIVGFSNSKRQKAYIEEIAQAKGLENVHIITGNVVDYEFEPEAFDRVISIEMFEHMKNYGLLMAKVARTLRPGGKLFVHIFAHKDSPYHFEEGWMSTHFFTGGTMPSSDLLLYFQQDLKIQKQWWLSGVNYEKTLNHWLEKFISNKKEVWPHLVDMYGEDKAQIWYNRWQVYYLAAAEFFGYDKGKVFGTAHYLFEKPAKS